MKQIRVLQNNVGRYNLVSNEQILSFSMAFVDDGKVYEENGIKAIMHYSGTPNDADDFADPLDNMYHVAEKCLDYSRTVWSSTDYEAQCLLFARMFSDNYEELCENRILQQKEDIQKEIERLTERLTRLYGYDEIEYEVNSYIDKQVARYSKFIADSKLNDLKDGTDSYDKEKERVGKYQSKIDRLNKSRVKTKLKEL